jgi:hypothetical protein
MRRPQIWAVSVAACAASATLVALSRELTVLWPLIYPGLAADKASLSLTHFTEHAMLPWFVLAAAINAVLYGAIAWLVSRFVTRQSTTPRTSRSL